MTAIEVIQTKQKLTRNCSIECYDCLLSVEHNGEQCSCEDLLRNHPQHYESIVEKWSNQIKPYELSLSTLVDETNRMTQNCVIECNQCPLYQRNSGSRLTCFELREDNPCLYIHIVTEWSKQNPIE